MKNKVNIITKNMVAKADKLSRNERAKQKALIHRTFPEAEHLITFSSFAKEGVEEVTELLDTLVNN